MKQSVNPVVGAIIVIIAVVVVGLIGWKLMTRSGGIDAPPPASAANPNGGGPAMPTNAPTTAPN